MSTKRQSGLNKIALCLILAGSVFCLSYFLLPPGNRLEAITGQTMGTFYEVTLAGELGQNRRDELKQQIENELVEINRQMSTYDPKSEISRFNKSAATEWFEISPEFAFVTEQALEVARQTDGAFDPTIGPLVDLWHFGSEIEDLKIPDDETIASVRSEVGYRHLEVKFDPPAIRKTIPQIRLDLSAIAKGYAVDAIAALLEQEGIDNFLVNVGGEVIARGRKTDGSLWRLGMEKPIPNERKIERIVPLNNIAMATSGDYRNFYEVDGKRYSHTINPNTGRPVTHALRSASVLSETCLKADAYATTMMVLGLEAGKEFAQKHDLAVGLLERDDSSEESYYSPEFEQIIKE